MSILNVKTTTAGFQQQKQQFSLKRFNFLNFSRLLIKSVSPNIWRRQRETEIQRETERDRETERETDRGREGQRETGRERQTEADRKREKDRER